MATMSHLTTIANQGLRSLAATAAGLLAVLALLGPLALLPTSAGASPPAVNEYKLNLPGSDTGNSDSSSGGSSVLVPVAIGAGVLTIVAVAGLVRYRRQQD